jgi:hypothetical protein
LQAHEKISEDQKIGRGTSAEYRETRIRIIRRRPLVWVKRRQTPAEFKKQKRAEDDSSARCLV